MLHYNCWVYNCTSATNVTKIGKGKFVVLTWHCTEMVYLYTLYLSTTYRKYAVGKECNVLT